MERAEILKKIYKQVTIKGQRTVYGIDSSINDFFTWNIATQVTLENA